MSESTPNNAIVVDNVSKRFELGKVGPTSMKERLISRNRSGGDDFWALKDVSFDIEVGETFALLGHNGSGKSTLLKCIARTLTPTSGNIRIVGSVAALLELGAGFHPDLTGRENIILNASILGMAGEEVEGRLPEIFAFAELEDFADTAVKHYSSGMFARLGFAVAMFLEPDILLVDEVLSVGDESFQRKCLGEVRRFQREGRTIIVVTHSADMVRQICDRAAVLDHGELIELGTPARAIGALRAAFAKKGIEVPADLGHADNLERSNAVRFTDVTLHLPDPDRDWIRPGETLEVEVGFDSASANDDVVVAFEIHDQHGNRLVGINTDRLNSPGPTVDGVGSMRFKIDGVPLLGGVYDISVGLHNHDVSVSYDHREGAASFRVEHDTGLVGLVDMPLSADWE